MIPFEAAAGGGVVRIAREIIVEACGSDSDINPAAFPAQKSRSAYSAEELDLAEEIARRADPATVKFFLKALDGHDKRFGTTRFLPLPASVSEKLSECYQSDLLEFAKASPSHSPGRS